MSRRKRRKEERAAREEVLEPGSPQAIAKGVRKSGEVRAHMFLIIAGSVAMATIVTAGLHAAGVDTLWKRYLPALVVAYLTFFAGIWLWLHLTGLGRDLGVSKAMPQRDARRKARSEASSSDLSLQGARFDLPIGGGGGGGSGLGRGGSGGIRGGGGNFDGGGASGSWTPAVVAMDVGSSAAAGDAAGDTVASSLTEGVGDAVGEGGGEGAIVLVIAIVLVVIALVILFGAAGYIIYQAPTMLSEVVFELLLAQPLAKGMNSIDSARWFRIVLERTWTPFILLVLATMAFASYAARVAPKATTALEVLRDLGL